MKNENDKKRSEKKMIDETAKHDNVGDGKNEVKEGNTYEEKSRFMDEKEQLIGLAPTEPVTICDFLFHLI